MDSNHHRSPCKGDVSPLYATFRISVLLPALPGPELSGYSVRLFALWLKTAKHPRYFQGSRQWDLGWPLSLIVRTLALWYHQ